MTESAKRGPWRSRDYRKLFAAQVIALFGTGLATVALALLAYDLAGPSAGSVLGTALMLKMFVYVTVAPVAAAYADRVPRRRFLISLDVVRALVVLALPLVTDVWQIYLLVALLQAASAVFTPTFQATLPDILPDERDYTRALSASQLASSLENLLSPMLAAAVLGVVSFHWLFIGTTAGFLASAALVLTATIPQAVRSPRTRPWDRITAGVRLFAATPRLRAVLGLDLAVAGAGALVMVNTVNYVRDELGGSDSDVGLLLAANGAGTMLVALALPRILDHIAERTVLLTGALTCCAGVVAAVLTAAMGGGWPAVTTTWFVLGVGAGLALTPIGRVLRRCAQPVDRPALFAAQFSLSHACWLLSYPISGYLVSAAGYTVGWLALAAITLAGAVAALVLWPRPDPTRLRHSRPARLHRRRRGGQFDRGGQRVARCPVWQVGQIPKISAVWLMSVNPLTVATVWVHFSTAGTSISTVRPQARQTRWWWCRGEHRR